MYIYTHIYEISTYIRSHIPAKVIHLSISTRFGPGKFPRVESNQAAGLQSCWCPSKPETTVTIPIDPTLTPNPVYGPQKSKPLTCKPFIWVLLIQNTYVHIYFYIYIYIYINIKNVLENKEPYTRNSFVNHTMFGPGKFPGLRQIKLQASLLVPF